MLLGVLERREAKLLCSNCMKKWKENGKKPEEKPEPVLLSNLRDNRCPVCREVFRSYFPF
jgi:hypothetical protein